MASVQAEAMQPEKRSKLSRRLFRSRVARQVFGQFVLCALLPLSVLAYFSFQRLTQHLTAEAVRVLEEKARNTSMAVAERVVALADDLDALRKSLKGLQSGAFAPRLAFDTLAADLLGHYEGLVLAALDGSAEHPLLGDPARLGALSAFEAQHLAAEGVLVAVRHQADRALTFVVASVPTADGPAMLYGEVREPFLWTGGDATTSDGDPFEIRHAGRTLFASHPGLFPEASAMAIDRPTTGELAWDAAGEPYLAAYRTLYLTPQFGISYTILCGRSRAQVLEPVAGFRTLFVLVLVLTFLVIALLGMSGIRKTLTPISVLREATRRVAENRLESRVRIDGHDEFAELGESFNAMVEEIQDRTAQLERANRAKSDFLANVSHEIRTPMTAILGYAELCRSGDTDEDDRGQYLAIIHQNGKHLLEIVNQILDVSKLEAGHTMVASEALSPGAIAQEAVALLRASAKEKGLQLDLACDGPIPETIQGDATRLRQILVNLIGNAVKFTEEGSVRVTLRMERVGERPLLAFEVLDTGVGIAPELVERVFEPFVQVDGSRSRRFGGTGLGLSISRTFARQLGGELSCESRPGEGSRFRLTVDPGPLVGVALTERIEGGPAPEPEAKPGPEPEPVLPRSGASHVESAARSAPPAAPAPEPPAVRVLLAEDVLVNRRLVAKMLERAGATVAQAENGRVASDKALAALGRGEPFDLILMDMQMPEMDGYEATRLLRSSGYGAPIVALTSHAIEGERERCLAAGCDDFANKPIAQAALAALVRKHCPASGAGAAADGG